MQLLQRIADRARDCPTHRAYFDATSGASLTYRELFQGVARLIDVIRRDLLCGQHERAAVILHCGNRIEFPIWLLALIHAGCDVLPLPVDSTATEIAGLAERVHAIAIISDVRLQASTIERWPTDRALNEAVADRSCCDERVEEGDLLLSSSGSTAIPKIVRRSAVSLDAVSRNMVEAIGIVDADRMLAAVPLSHSYGLEHGLLAPFWAGATAVLVNGMDWPTLTRVCASPGKDGCTILPAVPAMIEMLATLPDDSFAMPSLRLAYSAGGHLPRESAERFAERFNHRVGQIYGMTEIGSVTFNSPDDAMFDVASVGKPIRDVSIQVITPNEKGIGEIAVAAPSMLSGYFGDATAPFRDGYFLTGDIGSIGESGCLTLSGRAKLMIDVGGKKVNPLEIESVISAHPAVLECAIFPIRQSETVNRLCALIVMRDAVAHPSDETIRKFARERLSPYKVPRLIRFTTTGLPRNASGKLLRHLLEI